jgi:predicted dehydrogenase
MDMLSYLLGDPGVTAVRGELLPRDLEIKDNRLDEDPNSTYQIGFTNGVEAWAVPAGPRDFEIIGSEGSVRSMNQGLGAVLRGPESRDSSEPSRTETLTPETPSKMTTVVCLEDLLDAHESGRKTRGDVTVAHNLTEACLAVAESHRLGGAWVELPMENRDLYVFHV